MKYKLRPPTARLASAWDRFMELHDHAENLYSYHRAHHRSDIFCRLHHCGCQGLNFWCVQEVQLEKIAN